MRNIFELKIWINFISDFEDLTTFFNKNAHHMISYHICTTFIIYTLQLINLPVR